MKDYFLNKVGPILIANAIIFLSIFSWVYYTTKNLVQAIDQIPETYIRKDVQLEIDRRLEQKIDLLLLKHDIEIPSR